MVNLFKRGSPMHMVISKKTEGVKYFPGGFNFFQGGVQLLIPIET